MMKVVAGIKARGDKAAAEALSKKLRRRRRRRAAQGHPGALPALPEGELRVLGRAVTALVASARSTCDASSRVSQSFKIPDDFRAFMREVAAKVDFGDDPRSADAVLEHECGRGGSVERGRDVYRFTYLANGGHGRWEIELREQQIRDIARGLARRDRRACRSPSGTRTSRGDALLVWGEYDEDALRVRTTRRPRRRARCDACDRHARARALVRLWSIER